MQVSIHIQEITDYRATVSLEEIEEATEVTLAEVGGLAQLVDILMEGDTSLRDSLERHGNIRGQEWEFTSDEPEPENA